MAELPLRLALLCAIMVAGMASEDPHLAPEVHQVSELGEEAAVSAVERLTPLLSDYDEKNPQNWLSIEALKDPTAHHEELPVWFRHLHDTVVATSASNRREAQDATFILKPPLCTPGDAALSCPEAPEGMGACFSLESANYQGHYLSKMADQDQLALETKSSDARAADQTFCMTAGLAGAQMLSLQVLSTPGKFVSVRESLLRLCDNKPGDEVCGVLDDADYKRTATMYALQGIFNGRCSGPEKADDCECLPGWLGRKCDQECPGGHDEALGTCNGNGACALHPVSKIAACTCNSGWLGVSCAEKCPEHNGQVCSGDEAGTCWLSPDNGAACKCKEQRKGKLCEIMCPGVKDSASPPCNGHGTCELNETGDNTICRCDRGFLGAECELPCPTGDKGLICSGFGKCAIDKLGLAGCECGDSRRGKACELKCPVDAEGFVCSGNGACVVAGGEAACACEDGFLGQRCEHKCKGVIEGRVCSGHGKCQIQANEHGIEQAQCVCDSTHGGEDCLLPCEADSEGNPCNGHGKCAGDGKCDCDNGFLGKACGVECPMKDGLVCGGHGKCLPPAADADSQTTGTCVCDKGFMGQDCGLTCPATDEGVICGGRGKCMVEGGHAVCKCKPGARGDACEFVCPGSLSSDQVCSGHGECHAHPLEKPLGAICTKCDTGYVGADCSLKCPNINAKGRPCGGNGKCMETNGIATCSCNEGFLGEGCEYDCPRDRAGRPCAAEGRCQVLGDKAHCNCNDGFLGHNCDLVCPRHLETKELCSGHGDCVVGPDGAKANCECASGYTGRDCSAGCPAGENKLSCSGHGSCDIVGTEGKCKCDEGFSGEDCGQYTCSSPNSVYNKVTAQCVCPVGSICCERQALEEKQMKEKQIRQLEAQTQEIHERIERATQMLSQR